MSFGLKVRRDVNRHNVQTEVVKISLCVFT